MITLRYFLLIVLVSHVFAQDEMLGCYSDTSSRPLLNGLAGNPNLPNPFIYEYQSSGKCTQFCSSHGFIYAGTENGNECYCGDYTPPLSLRVHPSKCNIPCVGYPLQDCGGAKYLNVYIVSDRKPSTSLTTKQPTSTSTLTSTSAPTSTTTSTTSRTRTRTRTRTSSSSSSPISSASSSISSTTTSSRLPITITPSTFTRTSAFASKSPVSRSTTSSLAYFTSTSSTQSTYVASPTTKTGGSSQSFIENKALAASIFTLAAVIFIAGLIGGYIFYRRRTRQKSEEMKCQELPNPNFPGYLSRRSSISLQDNIDYTKALRVTNPD